jgi:hypothetical protein
MPRSILTLLTLALVGCCTLFCAAEKPVPKAVRAVVETTLATADKHIRQFAFDGDPDTYFLSKSNAGKADHFTLVFDSPVAVTSITASTGRPEGGDRLNAGVLQVSKDGQDFKEIAKFADGTANAKLNTVQVKAIRIQPAADLTHPLAVCELKVESAPSVAVFKYPVEYVIDAVDDAALRPWFEKVARLCEREYSPIAERLASPGFRPPTVVTMSLKSDYRGVAEAGGGRIKGSVAFFKAHPDDVGAFIHETVHIIQSYRTPGNPGWLVEGIADYVRFYEWEPKKPARLKPEQAKYNGSYRTTAAFLAFLTEKYDRDIVAKLNRAMREGEYKEELFRTLTRKSVQELEKEWQESLRD